MSKIDKLLSEAAVEENNNASNKIEQSEVVAVDCSTFEKTQSQVFGNTFSIVFMGIYAEEKDVAMLRPDIEYVLGKMKHISEYCGLRSSESVCFTDSKYEDAVAGIPNTYATYDIAGEMISFVVCFEPMTPSNIKRYVRMFGAMNRLMTDFNQRETSFFKNELILADLQHAPVNADDAFRATDFKRSDLTRLCYESYNPDTLLFTLDSIEDGAKNISESTKTLSEYLTKVYMLRYDTKTKDYYKMWTDTKRIISDTIAEIHKERNKLRQAG